MFPFFTQNDSDIQKLEGLYIKERTPPSAIQGANLNTVCVVGQAIRGPVGQVVEVDSPARFKEVFGDRDQGSGGAIASDLWKALLNKPFGTLLVVRVAATAATAATGQDAVGVAGVLKVDATSVGTWGNNITATVAASSDGNVAHFKVTVSYLGGSVTYDNLDFTGTNDNSLTVVGDDAANWVKLTKLKSGTPVNGAITLAGGADGTIADSDYTASALGVAAVSKDLNGNPAGVVFVAEHSSAALKTAIQPLAAASSDRLFLVCADAETTATTAAITEVGTFTRSDRIVYCFNHPYTLDPATATSVVTHPTSWMASVLSQIDVDIHPGEEDTKPFLAGISKLSYESLTRDDYIALKAAGIAALERDNGFDFVSGVTTSLTVGKTEITRRRMTDFLQLALAKGLKNQVKKKNTLTRRKSIVGLIDSFLGGLKAAERVVEDYLIDDDVLNTATSRGLGVERILVRVRLIGHILELVLETEIGTLVTIKEQ